jgi:hypothetical protein
MKEKFKLLEINEIEIQHTLVGDSKSSRKKET